MRIDGVLRRQNGPRRHGLAAGRRRIFLFFRIMIPPLAGNGMCIWIRNGARMLNDSQIRNEDVVES